MEDHKEESVILSLKNSVSVPGDLLRLSMLREFYQKTLEMIPLQSHLQLLRMTLKMECSVYSTEVLFLVM
jgi:hypothetical protein